MRHVRLTTFAVATALVAIVACEQQAPDRNPTVPDELSFARAIGGTCDAARLKLIGTQQSDLYAKPYLDTAQTMIAAVTATCPSPSASLMLDYIQWTIDHRGIQRSGTTDTQLLTHWNTVFPYAGYSNADQPSSVPTTIFGTEGAAKVIDWNTTAEIKTPSGNAALTQYPQLSTGDQRDHLFVIYPISPGCLTGTNLRQSGPCYQFSAFPHVNPKFDPRVKVGICQPLHDGEAMPLRAPALGHLEPLTRITDSTSTYPADCAHLADAAPVGSWNGGLGNVMKRLAWMAKKAVTPEPLYAVHGGLGGLGGGLSPFGAVDVEVFHATFTADTIGLPPKTPEAGTWTQQTKAPGTILVQGSLGDISSNLAVLNQAGGNCGNCFGLLLQGNLASAGPAATEGIYDASFVALQAQTNMKEALFVLRDSGGRDIARITYAVRNNKNLILWNDTKGSPGLILGAWAQNKKDSFRIRVDLDNHNTQIFFNGLQVGATYSYVNTAAANFATISADFRGIDSGTMGWDDILVTRLSDKSF